MTADLKKAGNFTSKMACGKMVFVTLDFSVTSYKKKDTLSLLLALPRNNGMDAVNSVSFGVLSCREELTTSTPLFLGNAKSKDKVSFFCK